jgi:hypothetical protein
MGELHKPVILSAIHHRQKPLIGADWAELVRSCTWAVNILGFLGAEFE